MKLSSLRLSLFLFTALTASSQNPFSVRILLGVTDAEPVRWDGTILAQGGTVTALEPWRFEGSDGIAGLTWHCSTHLVRLFSGTTPTFAKGVNSFVPNGVIANLSAPD
jgi:hypothetical protein